jgi:hypothetical protein
MISLFRLSLGCKREIPDISGSAGVYHLDEMIILSVAIGSNDDWLAGVKL